MMNLIEEIKGAKNVVILGHIKPDGDCIGSATALFQYIQKVLPDVEVDVVLDEFRNVYSSIPVIDKIQNCVKSKKYDVCFCMDCGSIERLGRFANIFKAANKTIVIDHHKTTNNFGDICNVNPDKSSTCEYLFDFLDKDFLDKGIASSLFTGLISDTGVFRYSCTSTDSFKMACELMKHGIDNTKIIEESFYAKSYKGLKFMAACILKSCMSDDNKMVYTVATKEMMKEHGITKSEIEGVVESLRDTEGVEVAIFAYEIESDMYKISMRSKTKVDVSKICSKFGGGGHIRASGCTLVGEFKELFKKLLDETKLELL